MGAVSTDSQFFPRDFWIMVSKRMYHPVDCSNYITIVLGKGTSLQNWNRGVDTFLHQIQALGIQLQKKTVLLWWSI